MGTANSPENWTAEAGSKPPVALIAGPTASGKSDLAIALALELQARRREGVIINADSMQVYADLQVLSARPTAGQMGGIPHRLFGTWDGSEACSAVDWARAAKDEIAKAHAEDAVPILVGGTGLYLQTLLEGIAPIPEISEEVRYRVRNSTKEELRKDLGELDPWALARIGENDTQRMCRALEVVLSTGKTLGYWQRHKEGGIGSHIDLHPLILLPDREWLYRRCNDRFAWMLENGAVGEVAALLERRLDPDLPVMRAIGVPEISNLVMIRSPLAPTIEEQGGTATRQYAKRQYTWFRNQSPGWWPRTDGSESKSAIILQYFERLLQSQGLTS